VGARFSTPVQIVSEALLASYTMGTGSFPGVKRPGRGVDHPPSYSAEVKERVDIYLYSLYGPPRPALGCSLAFLPSVMSDIAIKYSHFGRKLANGPAAYFFTVRVPLPSSAQHGR
jgi:hypothetical protein